MYAAFFMYNRPSQGVQETKGKSALLLNQKKSQDSSLENY